MVKFLLILFALVVLILITIFVGEDNLNKYQYTVSTISAVVEIFIAFAAIYSIITPKYKMKSAYYGISEDGKMINIFLQYISEEGKDISLNCRLGTQLRLLLPIGYDFFLSDLMVSSDSSESRSRIKLTHDDNIQVIRGFLYLKDFVDIVQGGLKNNKFLSMWWRIPGSKVVITIEDTYGRTHKIEPLPSVAGSIRSMI